MAFLKKENNAQSFLASNINDTATSLTVLDASSFPVSGDFLVTLWDKENYLDPSDDTNMEVIKVTSVAGNVFTIERGQENTSGVAHTANEAVEMLITQGHFEEIEDAVLSHIEDVSNPHQVEASQIPTDVTGETVQDKLDSLEGDVDSSLKNVVEDLTPELGGNLSTNGKWISGDGDSEGLFIDTDGKVGIGTMNASSALDVVGDMELTGDVITDGDTMQWIMGNSGQITFTTVSGGSVFRIRGSDFQANQKFRMISSNVFWFGDTGGINYSGGNLQIGTGNVYSSLTPILYLNHTTGNFGIRTSSPSARLHIVSATEQFRLGYNTSNYFSTTVASDGAVTFDAVGSGAKFSFSDKVDIASDTLRLRTAKTPSSASDTGNVGDICWDSGYVYICVATDTWKRAELITW